MMNAQIFAIYTPEIDRLKPHTHGSFVVHESELLHRIQRVLRLKVHDPLQLFGKKNCFTGTIAALDKTACTIAYDTVKLIQPCCPHIHLYLPLLEKQAWESALTAATVLGVTTITPVITEKTKRSSFAAGEPARLERVMIAAAEQSKQFLLPHVDESIPLASIKWRHPTIMFDLHGTPIQKSSILQEKPQELCVLFGPEGDLTDSERAYLDQHAITRLLLTPTVLRTEDAVMVGIGFLRSWFNAGH